MDGEELLRRSLESVQLKATKDRNSEVIILTRGAAQERCVQLEAEGWHVEIVDITEDLDQE